MTTPEINPIPKAVDDFVEGIEDVFIKAKLQQLIRIAREPAAEYRFARHVKLVDEATAGWQSAVVNQHASIKRLLGLNMDAGIRERNLEREVERLRYEIQQLEQGVS
jgi:sigma54-dependent transcription regulator